MYSSLIVIIAVMTHTVSTFGPMKMVTSLMPVGDEILGIPEVGIIIRS